MHAGSRGGLEVKIAILGFQRFAGVESDRLLESLSAAIVQVGTGVANSPERGRAPFATRCGRGARGPAGECIAAGWKTCVRLGSRIIGGIEPLRGISAVAGKRVACVVQQEITINAGDSTEHRPMAGCAANAVKGRLAKTDRRRLDWRRGLILARGGSVLMKATSASHSCLVRSGPGAR